MSKSHWISDLHWVRSTQQQRGHKTQTKILEAAEKLFSKRGVQDTSIADIAKEAGCSVGGVYHHFRDKRALTHALLKLISDQMIAFSDIALSPERWKGAKIVDIIDGLLELSLASHEEMPLRKQAKIEIMREEKEIQSHFAELNEKIASQLTVLFEERTEEITHPKPALAIQFAIIQFQAMTEAYLMQEISEQTNTGCVSAEFVEEMKRSLSAYMGLE